MHVSSTGFLFCLFLFLFSARCFADDARKAASSNESPFAINAVGGFHQRDALGGEIPKRMEILNDLGVRWDRADFWWGVIEPKEGQFDWDFTDKLVALYEQHNLKVFPILCYASAWARGNGWAPANELEWQQFASYTYQVVNRYKDRIHCWEIWNEPNILPFWAPEPRVEDYVRLLKEAYKAAKRADPNCQIVGVCTAGLDLGFIEKVYQLGAKDSFDVLSCHYYHTGEPERGITRDIQNLRNLMTRYGDEGKKIWITEMGVTSHPNRRHGVTEEEQARLLVRNYMTCLATGVVERVFWFTLLDWTDVPEDDRWDSYLGIMRFDHSKKPSYTAYQVLVSQLDGYRYVGDPNLDPDVTTWLWQNGDDLTLVAYTKSGSRRLEIPVAVSSLRKVSLDGKSTRIRVHENNKARCVVDESPTYFVGVDRSLLLKASFAFAPDSLICVPQEERKVMLRFHNPFPEKIIGKVRLDAPSGWHVYPQTKKISLDPNSQMEIPISFSAPEGSESSEHTIIATAVVLEGLPNDPSMEFLKDPFRCSMRVDVGEQSTLRLRPVVEGNELATYLETSSYLSEPSKAKIQISFPWGKKTTRVTMPVGERVTAVYRHPLTVFEKMRKPKPIIASIDLGKGKKTIRKEFRLTLLPLLDEAPRRGISGWGVRNPAMSLTKLDSLSTEHKDRDFSADVWMAFTRDKLHVLTKFKDATPAQNSFDGEDIWKGDSLELYLGFAGPEERAYFSERDFQVLVSPGQNGKNAQAIFFPAKRILTESEIQVNEDPEGYVLEIAIPLAAFGQDSLKDGEMIGLDVSVHDYMPGPPETVQALMWNGTGADWLTPRDWGIALVRK